MCLAQVHSSISSCQRMTFTTTGAKRVDHMIMKIELSIWLTIYRCEISSSSGAGLNQVDVWQDTYSRRRVRFFNPSITFETITKDFSATNLNPLKW